VLSPNRNDIPASAPHN